MAVPDKNWTVVSESEFSWEQEALDFLKANLGSSVLHAWSNLEFITQHGSIYEVDLLLLTTRELYVVEIKSWTGQLSGNQKTWLLSRGGSTIPRDNPIFLTNRKCKALKGLLGAQPAFKRPGARMPYVAPLVFLSHPDLDLRLPRAESPGVYHYREILRFLDPPGMPDPRHLIDRSSEQAVLKAMEQVGLHRRKRTLVIGDYELEGLLGEGPGYQDHLARHASFKDTLRRVRTYGVSLSASKAERERSQRAAEREFRLVQSCEHPGIIKPNDFRNHELGPALIYPYYEDAERLDLFVESQGRRLDLWERLALLRQLADILRYAHDKNLIHRSLAPQNVLVCEPSSARPQLKVINWQTGLHPEAGTGTLHVAELLEEPVSAYVAPEALLTPDKAGIYSDLFSLGAVGYFLLTGQAPAESFVELQARLREQGGLRPSSVADGLHPELDELIYQATRSQVQDRLERAEDFLALLEAVEEALTAPEERELSDPLEAGRDDRLEHGLVVRRRLGRGSVSVALLVERDGQPYVLKVAHSLDQNPRIEEEAEVLGKLDHPRVVKLVESLAFGPRRGLLLERAGEESLARRLQQEGALQLDLLGRFGAELLEVVAYLEATGIAHRDIKPANIGVARRPHDKALQLVLFDFSLARAPVDNIYAGTQGYLDPFLPLRKPRRWDLAAERYAAAVTLYEMATGVLPQWGDGLSDPASSAQVELRLEPERLDPSLRETLTAFFQRALARDPARRYDNADEMLQAWREAFASATTAGGSDEGRAPEQGELVDQAEPATPVTALGLSARALDVLDRLGVLSVRDLLSTPRNSVHYMRGIGGQTRREILEMADRLRERFPDVDVEPETVADRGGEGLEALVASLVEPGKQGGSPADARLREAVLGLDRAPGAAPEWPTAAHLADRLGLAPVKVLKLLPGLRVEWAENRSLGGVRAELEGLLQSQGGVMTADELAASLLALRGALSNDPGQRVAMAGAVVRAALEAEETDPPPRFLLYRDEGRLLVALSEEHLRFALALGELGDELAAEDPLLPPYRVVERLGSVPLPEGVQALSSHRLVRLAGAAGRRAAVSSRQELYPRGMDARRALILSQGALLGEQRLTLSDLRERVGSRYPQAERLPDRPELDRLLEETGWEFRWSEEEGAYLRPWRPGVLSSGSAGSLSRWSSTSGSSGPVSPEEAEARLFEERLRHAEKDGAFLVLMAPLNEAERTRESLVRRFRVQPLSLDALLLEAMHETAEEYEVDWSVVLETDASPESPAWSNLLQLVDAALPRVEERLLGHSETVLLEHLGLLARYGRLSLLETLRDRAGRPAGLHGLWLLVPTTGQQELPTLDGKAIPLLTPGQRARVPRSWLKLVRRESEQLAR